MKRFIKNLFIRVFKRKEYKESLKVMNKLLGIEEVKDNYTIFNYSWNNGAKRLVLSNYKKIWIRNGNKPQYKTYKIKWDHCYEFYIHFGYYIFVYLNLRSEYV